VINYHLLRELSRRHTISLLSLAETPQEARFAEAVRPYCEQLQVVCRPIPRSILARCRNLLTDRDPFCVRQHHSESFRTHLSRWLQTMPFDVVHMTYTPMAQYAADLGDLPSVLALVDCMSRLFSSNAQTASNPLAKLYWQSQAGKMRGYEQAALGTIRRAVVATQADKDALPQSPGPVTVIPCGVDTDYFAPSADPDDGSSILFRGILSFPPNVDAASYFCRAIYPLVRRAVPNARLILAGRDPAPALRRLADATAGITLTGSLPDIRPVMARATVHVCPVRSGSGVKLKILEAMAMGKAIVTTSCGLSGIAAEPGRDLLVADGPEDFAGAVVRVLREPELRQRLGAAARMVAAREHAWHAVARRYEEVYSEACR